MSENYNAAPMPEFDYESESDTLTIWGGGPAASGYDLIPGSLIIFLDHDHATPVGLLLTPAAKILAPRLPIKNIANIKPPQYPENLDWKIEYDSAKDTLWLGNSKPAETAHALIKNAVEIWFQAGSENIQNQDGKIPSGVMIYNAVKRLEPVISAELAGTLAPLRRQARLQPARRFPK